MQAILTEADLSEFLAVTFPQVKDDFAVERLTPDGIILRLKVAERHLRPGGTISGPTLFALADVGAWCAVLAHIGPVALAVTTNLNINFLRKPEPGPLSCTCRLLKLGKRLAVIDASIFGADADELVAHATATYSIPPR